MKKTGLLVAVILLAAFVIIVLSSMSLSSEVCAVCVTYNGRTDCGRAAAATREDAIRTAKDNACASLTSGMTSSIACGNTEPTSVTCEE